MIYRIFKYNSNTGDYHRAHMADIEVRGTPTLAAVKWAKQFGQQYEELDLMVARFGGGCIERLTRVVLKRDRAPWKIVTFNTQDAERREMLQAEVDD